MLTNRQWWNGKVWAPSLDKSDWASLGGSFSTDLVAVSKGIFKIDLFGIGLDKHAYVKSFDGKNWAADWQALGGSFDSALDAVSWASNRLDVFGIGEKKNMLHRSSDVPGKWMPSGGEWESVGGSHIYP